MSLLLALLAVAPEPPVVPTHSGEVSLRRVYIRKRGKLYLFNTVEEADAWDAADEAAEQAIQQAQKTSRRARKRARERIYKSNFVMPAQTVQIDAVAALVNKYDIHVNLPELIARQDYAKFIEVMHLAMAMQDEEDIEILLLLA
jgi:hypothetical protein